MGSPCKCPAKRYTVLLALRLAALGVEKCSDLTVAMLVLSLETASFFVRAIALALVLPLQQRTGEGAAWLIALHLEFGAMNQTFPISSFASENRGLVVL